mgnify:CR=1 FL=1
MNETYSNVNAHQYLDSIVESSKLGNIYGLINMCESQAFNPRRPYVGSRKSLPHGLVNYKKETKKFNISGIVAKTHLCY